MVFSGASDGKESACNSGDLGLIPRLRRSPGEWNGYPFQYSCLGNLTDRGTNTLKILTIYYNDIIILKNFIQWQPPGRLYYPRFYAV